MLRRSLSLLLGSGGKQTKGQLGNLKGTLLDRHSERSAVAVVGNSFNDIAGGGGGEGQLSRQSFINTRFGSGMGNAHVNEEMISRNNIGTGGMTSLAYQMNLLEQSLLYYEAPWHIGNRAHKKSGMKNSFKDIVASEYQLKDPEPIYDDFLPNLLREKVPNTELSVLDVKKLRTQQRLVRSEIHARLPILLENAFAFGVPKSVKSKSNATTAQKQKKLIANNNATTTTDGFNSYIAGSNLASLGRFFNMFRLTRLSFTLDGEIVFTADGTLKWQSLEETHKAELLEAKKTFSDRKYHRFISDESMQEGNRVYLPENEAEKKAIASGGEAVGESNADSNTSIVAAGSEITKSDVRLHSNAVPETRPSVSSHVHQIPALQRTNIAGDMQQLLSIAVNAVEIELRAIDREMKAVNAELEKEIDAIVKQNKSDKKTAAIASLEAAAARRINRLVGTSEAQMNVICDAIFMCGRGCEVIDELLDAVEQQIEEAAATTTEKEKKTRHPHLLRHLVDVRQRCFSVEGQ